MKKFLPALLFLFTLGFGAANAQDQIYFYEDFSGGMPSDWTILDRDGLTPAGNVSAYGGTWWVSPTAAPEARAAISSSWYAPAGRSDDWMITNGISIPQLANQDNKIFLTWFGQAVDPSYPDGYKVRLSTTDTDPASFTVTLADIPREVAPDGTIRSVDLTAYAGQTIYLAWINDSNDQFILVIDDITIAEFPAIKAGSNENLTQGYNTSDANVNLAASFISTGHQTITSADLNYSIDGGATSTQNITGLNLSLLSSGNVALPGGLNLAPGKHSVSMWLTNLNGTTNGSDTLTFDVSVMEAANAPQRLALVEGFTSSSCGPCKAGNENLKNVIASMAPDDRPLVVKVQQNFPGNGDPYTTDELVSRRDYYGISSIPNVTVNGNYTMKNSASIVASDLTGAKDDVAFVSIDAKYILDTTNQSIRIYGTYTTQSAILDDTRMMIGIYETITYNNVATNGETEFPTVIKKYYPNENGIVIPANTEVGVPQSFDYTYVFNGNYRLPANGLTANRINHATEHSVEDFNNLRAALWIEYPTDLFVLNAMDAVAGSPTSTDNLPKVVTGLQTFPNPTTDNLTINVDLAESTAVSIDVLDVRGRLVNNVANNVQGIQGAQRFNWTVGDAPAGSYFVRVRAGKSEVTTRVSVVK
ncbi:MAG: choice-of-anchor J domain-containing protein [Saprospiraceae bacterium]